MTSSSSATNGFVGLVGQIDEQAWASPGLGDWDLRALVGHTSRSLITVTQYVDQPVETEQIWIRRRPTTSPRQQMAGADQAADRRAWAPGGRGPGR